MTKEELRELKDYVHYAWDGAMAARDSANDVCSEAFPDGLTERTENKLHDICSELSYAASNASTACDILEKMAEALEDVEPDEEKHDDVQD